MKITHVRSLLTEKLSVREKFQTAILRAALMVVESGIDFDTCGSTEILYQELENIFPDFNRENCENAAKSITFDNLESDNEDFQIILIFHNHVLSLLKTLNYEKASY